MGDFLRHAMQIDAAIDAHFAFLEFIGGGAVNPVGYTGFKVFELTVFNLRAAISIARRGQIAHSTVFFGFLQVVGKTVGQRDGGIAHMAVVIRIKHGIAAFALFTAQGFDVTGKDLPQGLFLLIDGTASFLRLFLCHRTRSINLSAGSAAAHCCAHSCAHCCARRNFPAKTPWFSRKYAACHRIRSHKPKGFELKTPSEPVSVCKGIKPFAC